MTNAPIAPTATDVTSDPTDVLPVPAPAGARAVAVLASAIASATAVVVGSRALGGWIGVADNADGKRLYCGAGLAPVDGPSAWRGLVVTAFRTGAPVCGDPNPSSALALLRVAVGFTRGGWDLRTLGVLYAVLLVAALTTAAFLASARRPANVALLLPIVLPLALPWFTRFIVSTYGEPAGLLGVVVVLAGLVAVAVTRGEDGRARHRGALALTAAGGVLAATAKAGYVPALLVAVVVCVLLARPRRVGVVTALVAVAVAAAPVGLGMYWQGHKYGAINTYNFVLTAVGPASAGDVLPAVGLPPEYAARLGRAYYPDGDEAVPGWERNVKSRWHEVRGRALVYVATHPGVLVDAAATASTAASDPRLAYLPAVPLDRPGAVPSQSLTEVSGQGQSRDAFVGWLDARPLPWWPPLVVAAALLGAAWLAWRRPTGPVATLVTVGVAATAGAVAVAAAAVVGDGFFELAKHVWLASFLLVVAACCGLAAAAVAAAGRWRRAIG